MTIEDIEKRFCECTKLIGINLAKFPIQKGDYKEQKQETIKELSDKYGFVPTPIFLVDTMIAMEIKNLKKDSITCDFCAGCGQYTVRLLRYMYKKFNVNVEDFLKNNHYITELQAENCAALVYIFGPNINLYVGDSMNLKYSDEEDKGILFFNEETKKWENNKLIDALLTKEIFNTNKQFLSFIFANYKHNDKIVQFVNDIKSGKVELKKNEEVKVEETVVEENKEVKVKETKSTPTKQKKEKVEKKKEVVVVVEEKKTKKVKVEKEKVEKPKKQVKKKIGDNTKEEADEMFGFAPLKLG